MAKMSHTVEHSFVYALIVTQDLLSLMCSMLLWQTIYLLSDAVIAIFLFMSCNIVVKQFLNN
jgi:hypothetical protein